MGMCRHKPQAFNGYFIYVSDLKEFITIKKFILFLNLLVFLIVKEAQAIITIRLISKITAHIKTK